MGQYDLAKLKAKAMESKRKAAETPRGERTEAGPTFGEAMKDYGLGALTGLRRGGEAIAGMPGDLSALQRSAVEAAAEKLGIDKSKAPLLAKYTSLLSLFPSSEEIGGATDVALEGTKAQELTRHEAKGPFGKGGDVLGEGVASLATGPEALLTKGALAALPLAVASKGGLKKMATKTAAKQFGLPPKAATKGKKQAITAVSLRDKPLDEAIDIARSEQHLIPKTEGGYVGAPYSAKTKADLEMIRKKFDEDVAAGAAGADWYPRAQEWIKTMAGDDPARQSELARNLALFSAQADPKGNLGFSVAARNAAIMGEPAEKVRTGQQARTYKEAFETGKDIKLGKKTGIYAGHMDPTRSSPTTGTNDIWHARALGYTKPGGEPWSSALTPQQHAFMDAETVLAVDRANAAEIGGRTDWTPGEIQAAPWVAGKGRGLEKSRGMTPEEGLAEASKTYPDYAPSFTAYGTHEMAPGKQTGHLPGVDLNAEPESWWRGSQDRDILYDAQGAYVGPTEKTTGVFPSPEGGYDFNPMESAKPLVGLTGASGRRVVDDPSKQMMTGTEAFRAMMDAQDAGAWSMTIPGQRMSHSNAFAVPLPEGREELAQALLTAKGINKDYDILPQPQERALITNFGADPGIGTAEKKAVRSAFPEAEAVRREGDYIGYGDEWRGGAAEGQPAIEGTDAVTKMMLSKLNPAQEAAFSKPEVRANVLAKFDRDQRLAAQTGQPVRKDLQFAREIFAKEGIAGLRSALGKGLLPAVAVGAFLPYALEDGGTGGGT